MNYSQHEIRQYILEALAKQGIKFEVNDFESGASMIDIWHDNKFYVIQLEIESVGLSLVDNDNPGFSTIPDERFFNLKDFIIRFKEILV